MLTDHSCANYDTFSINSDNISKMKDEHHLTVVGFSFFRSLDNNKSIRRKVLKLVTSSSLMEDDASETANGNLEVAAEAA